MATQLSFLEILERPSVEALAKADLLFRSDDWQFVVAQHENTRFERKSGRIDALAKEPRAIDGRTDDFFGEILIWAHIDTEIPWINKDTDAEATDEEMQPVVDALPGNLEPNFRPFMYILNQAEHIVLIEARNEAGQRFSPLRAKRMFDRLCENLPADLPEVDVTVIPEEETLEKILAIKRLRKLEIFIQRPNPDDLGDDYKRIMGLLEQEGARSQRIEKVKAAKKPTLTPSEETRRLAVIASTNGYVSGEGKDESGTPVFESTKDHPKIRKLVVNTSTFATILSALRFYLRQAVGKPGPRG